MISPRTAQLALRAVQRLIDLEAGRNGGGRMLSADVLAAVTELSAAATGSVDGTKLDASAIQGAGCELLDVGAVASQLGISTRGVRKRLAKGALTGRRVGGRWVIQLEGPGHMDATAPQPQVADDAPAAAAEPERAEVPTRFRVVAACVQARVAGSLGIPDARGRARTETGMTFYRDALLPPDTNADDIARLLGKGMITEVTING